MASTSAPLPAGLDQYFQKEFALRDEGLRRASSRMRQALLEAGLDARQAEAAVKMVLAGNPASKESQMGEAAPSIRVPANAEHEVEKVLAGLSRLCAMLEPYLRVSPYVNREDERSVELRLVPWGGPAGVERALLDSPLAKGEERESAATWARAGRNAARTDSAIRAGVRRGWPLLAIASKTAASTDMAWSQPIRKETAGEQEGRQEAGHKASTQADLRRMLHNLADIRRRAHDLNPQIVFPPSLEAKWAEAGRRGGILRLPAADRRQRAQAFYEELAVDYAQALQREAGVGGGVRVQWEGSRTLKVEADLPKKR
ncbi:MAG: hypothetical protein M1530_03535 [Candidatus Marsarchaeota archaeon]|nr:hypothetical protein [Candidatus Marsarchaeota archaeon]